MSMTESNCNAMHSEFRIGACSGGRRLETDPWLYLGCIDLLIRSEDALMTESRCFYF